MTRVLFLGQKPIGERCFDALMARGALEVVGVVTNLGLDNWWRSRGVADRAQAAELPIVANEKRNEAALLALLEDSGTDVLLSVQHPWVLPSSILAATQGRAWNLHLAPLPEYKGWHACSHALLQRDARFGVTLHRMDPELDSGPWAYKGEFAIGPSDTALDLYRQAEQIGYELFLRLLDDLAVGREPPRTHLGSAGRLYRRAELDRFREVDLSAGAEEVDRVARAFHFPPFEPAYIRFGQRKIHLVPEAAAVLPNS